MRESDIIYQNGLYWVARSKRDSAYIVFREIGTHSVSDSAYNLDNDGLAIAKCRCDYLAKNCRYMANMRGK